MSTLKSEKENELPLATNLKGLQQNLKTLKDRGEGNIFMEILWHLVFFGVSSQKELPKKLGYTKKTIIAYLKKLEDQKLISFIRKRDGNEDGRPTNKWVISFGGMIALFVSFARIDRLRVNQASSVDIIAKKFENEWIFFEEWEHIKKNQWAKFHVESTILFYAQKHQLRLDSREKIPKEVRDLSSKYRIWGTYNSKDRNNLHLDINEDIKNEITREILGLKEAFGTHRNDKNYFRIKTSLPHLIQNTRLKRLYINELSYLKEKYELLSYFDKLLESTNDSEKLSDNYYNDSLNIERNYLRGW